MPRVCIAIKLGYRVIRRFSWCLAYSFVSLEIIMLFKLNPNLKTIIAFQVRRLGSGQLLPGHIIRTIVNADFVSDCRHIANEIFPRELHASNGFQQSKRQRATRSQ
jgi:hypothetical protein